MESKKIYLRALELDDYKVSVLWRNDPEILSMLCGQKYFVSEEAEKKWVLDASHDKNVRLAVCTKKDNIYIGNVYLTDINLVNRSAQSHVLIGNKDYWGGGYGRDAVMLLLDYAFNELGLHRIEASIIDSNIASLKMHQHCGYVIEGIKRNSVFKGGRFHDQTILSILRSEFDNIEK